MKYEGDDQHCEFFVYPTPGYTFAITHNSWIDFDEVDCWVD